MIHKLSDPGSSGAFHKRRRMDKCIMAKGETMMHLTHKHAMPLSDRAICLDLRANRCSQAPEELETVKSESLCREEARTSSLGFVFSKAGTKYERTKPCTTLTSSWGGFKAVKSSRPAIAPSHINLPLFGGTRFVDTLMAAPCVSR